MSRPTILALMGSLLLTLVFAYPLSVSPASTALDLGPDTRLFLWTLGWDTHALTHAPLALFDANIFFPEPRTLAYSEHQLGSALIAAPFLLATGDPLLAMNVTLLLSCALSGFGAFVLARELGLGVPASALCGVVFAFTPPRFMRLGQLHLATVQWIPFCLAFLHRYARGGTTRHAVAAALLFTAQAWTGGQSGLFLALAGLAWCLYSVLSGAFAPQSSWIRDGAIAIAVVLVLNVPFALPYFRVRGELGLERSVNEALVWSPNIESFAASPSHVHRLVRQGLGWEDRVSEHAKAFLFPGLLPLVLGIGALFARSKAPPAPPGRRTRWLDTLVLATAALAILIEAAGGIRLGPLSASGGGRALVLALALLGARLALDRNTRFGAGLQSSFRRWAKARMGLPAGLYVAVFGLSVWASLGPRFGLYEALYHVLPGFDFIRVPSRLTILSVLALAILAGFGLERWTSGRPLLAASLGVLTLVELASFPLDVQAYAIRPSAMDLWLARDPRPGAVAVFPIPDPAQEVSSARRHSAYMLGSTAHYRPLINGYSGFTPPEHESLFRVLADFPNQLGLSRLRDLGVRFAVFHRDGFDDAAWAELDQRSSRMGLERVASFDEGRVYEIGGSGSSR